MGLSKVYVLGDLAVVCQNTREKRNCREMINFQKRGRSQNSRSGETMGEAYLVATLVSFIYMYEVCIFVLKHFADRADMTIRSFSPPESSAGARGGAPSLRDKRLCRELSAWLLGEGGRGNGGLCHFSESCMCPWPFLACVFMCRIELAPCP